MASLEGTHDPEELRRMGGMVAESFPHCRGYVDPAVRCQEMNTKAVAGVVCRDFHVRLRWCILSSLCPQEASTLESCWGEVPSLKVDV